MPASSGMTRILFPILSLLCLGLASCGTAYQADFRAMVRKADANPATPEGPWKGTWKSDVNGHEGPLWCMLSEGDDGEWDFRYRAGWGLMQFGDYVHTVPVKENPDGSISFKGKMDLPGGVGVHNVEGRVTKDEFEATYSSERGDKGKMSLARP